MKRNVQWSIQTLDRNCDGLTEDEGKNLAIFQEDLISALTWAEEYVETGSGHCQLREDQWQEICSLLERMKNETHAKVQLNSDGSYDDWRPDMRRFHL